MIQNNNSSNKIKENKYKILRMSLLLGNGEEREETIKNFEDASREIDAMNDEIYLQDLEGKFYDTLTLEDEEKKLAILVDYIGGRVEQRMSLLEDFSNVTGYELTNLPIIKYSDRLEEYKNRLFYIREYLDNISKIEKLNKEIDSLENKLNNAYVSKAKSEERNKKSEEEILNRFNSIIRKKEDFKEINIENAEYKLVEIESIVQESKKSLEIFNKSFATLDQAGITGEEKEEYLSYVNSAKKVYYDNKELEYLVRLFIILNDIKTDYSQIIIKRNSINDILKDRISLRNELKIEKEDILYNIYNTLDRQYEEINDQKDNIEQIEQLNFEIENRKELTSELEKDNQKVEILSLLKEFCIIDTYDNEDLLDNNTDDNEIDIDLDSDELLTSEPELNTNDITDDILDDGNELDEESDSTENNDLKNSKKESTIFDEMPNIETNDIKTTEPEIENEEIDEEIDEEIIEEKNDIESNDLEETEVEDNQVISVSDAEKINIEEAIEKSNSVMKRVGEMLGVKIEPVEETSKEEKEPEESKEETPIQQEQISEPEPIATSEEKQEEVIPDEPNDFFTDIEPTITPNSNTEQIIYEETPKEENETSAIDITNNIFLNNNYDADPETNTEAINSEPVNNTANSQENPLFNSELANKTIDDVMANNQTIDDNKNDDFWFSQEETPLDLNSLPDINPNKEEPQNNIFFGNGDEPSLDFPNIGEQVTTEKEGA